MRRVKLVLAFALCTLLFRSLSLREVTATTCAVESRSST